MSEQLKVSLLTSCTVTRNFEPVMSIADMPIFETMNELCDWWVDALRGHHGTPDIMRTPGELYAGQSMNVITEIAQDIGHKNIYIVTGGVGLTRHTDKIVPYDFTSDKKADHNVHLHVTGEKFLPHVWWEKINGHLHNANYPISKLLGKTDIIVGALPKAFVKYIISDLQQIPQDVLESRVFILIPRSMMGSVPKGLHGAFVPYDNSYAEGTGYTRNDKAQRVAQKFIRSISTVEGAKAIALAIIELAMSAKAAPRPEPVDYEQMFEDHPSLVDLASAGDALFQAKGMGLTVGGKHQFAGAWRGAQGQIALSADKKELDAGFDAFDAMFANAKPRAFIDDEDLLEKLGLFIAAVRAKQPNWIFTAADIAKWGKLAYPEDQNIGQSNKLTHILSYHTKYLGLVRLDVGSKIGYKLAG